MKLSVLGAGNEVGRSCMLLSTAGKHIVMDAGIKVKDQDMTLTGQPKLISGLHLDAALIAHAHLDHSGFTPEVFRRNRCPIFMTSPTQGLSDLLIKDAKKIDPELPFGRKDIDSTFSNTIGVPYGMEHTINDIKFTFHDAGHIPGSAMIELKSDKKRIFYTSDFKTDETRLHAGAKQPEGQFDALIIESTYSKRYHQDRKAVEQSMIRTVKETLNGGGCVLFPTFAVGRTQELAMVLAAHRIDAPIYIDGMGRTASEIIVNFPRYLKNAGELRAALDNLKEVGRDKSVVTRQPSVIISTSGMLEGGPAISYTLALDNMKKQKEIDSSIIFTGYCVTGTGGWLLKNQQILRVKPREEGRKVRMVPINLGVYDTPLSAHAGRHELFKFIENMNPAKVICVHGDDTDAFAAELRENGFNAVAPKNGDSVTI